MGTFRYVYSCVNGYVCMHCFVPVSKCVHSVCHVCCIPLQAEDLKHLCAYRESREPREGTTDTHSSSSRPQTPGSLWSVMPTQFYQRQDKMVQMEHTAGQWNSSQQKILAPPTTNWFTASSWKLCVSRALFQNKTASLKMIGRESIFDIINGKIGSLCAKKQNGYNRSLIGSNTNETLISCPGAESKGNFSSYFGGRNNLISYICIKQFETI